MTSIVIELEEPQIKAREVKIDEATLRAAGWMSSAQVEDHVAEALSEYGCTARHCDESCGGTSAVIQRWHDDHHAGPYRFCYEQPCKDDLRDEVDA